jgi:predicted ATP-grasp superfamily ATP-dependent carboligase
MPEIKRVLVTDASSYKAVVVARFLRENYPNIEVVATDHRALSRIFHSRWVNRFVRLKPSIRDGQAYVEALADMLKLNEIDVLIPINSQEMDLLLRHRDLVKPWMSYWGDFTTFDLLNDKQRLRDYCIAHGIKSPSAFKHLEDVRYPIVVKPRRSSSSKGVEYVHTETELLARFGGFPSQQEFVIEQYILGFGAGYSCYVQNGEILVGYGHQRLAEFPVSGGSSVYRTRFHNPQMESEAKKLMKLSKWSGFAMIEFKIDSQGAATLIEVNPRIWGSVNQGLCDSANYFAPLLGSVEIGTHSNVRTYFSPLIYVSLLHYLLAGRIKPLWDFIKNWRNNSSDTSLIKDPFGWAGWLAKIL